MLSCLHWEGQRKQRRLLPIISYDMETRVVFSLRADRGSRERSDQRVMNHITGFSAKAAVVNDTFTIAL
jgi:hypothetical protein